MFLERNVGVTECPRSLNPRKAVAMAIFPIIVHFIALRWRSMHDVACEFACAVALGANVLNYSRELACPGYTSENNVLMRAVVNPGA